MKPFHNITTKTLFACVDICINDRNVGKTSISVKIKTMVVFVIFTPTLIMRSLKKKKLKRANIYECHLRDSKS